MDEGDALSRDMPKSSIIIKTSSRELKLKARDDIRHTVWFEVMYHVRNTVYALYRDIEC